MREGPKDPTRASVFVLPFHRPADEDAAPTRCLAGTRRIVGTGNLDAVDTGLALAVSGELEARDRQIRTQRPFGLRRVLEKCGRHRMLTGLCVESNLESTVGGQLVGVRKFEVLTPEGRSTLGSSESSAGSAAGSGSSASH